MWTPEQTRAVPHLLLEWYRLHARPMPWHGQNDPYHLLVAATMLQQTQVETVLPYLHRFLQRFPSVRHLAEAEEEEVLRHWVGLGYYSRARHLHRAAQHIVREHQGVVPCDPSLLRRLPGVGEYTAGAVASIACGVPEPALDANGYRILARLLAVEEDITRAPVRRKLWNACRQILPPDAPGDFNQALMDLGATICVARNPRCLICPLAGECAAFLQGCQNALPVLPPRRVNEKVQDVCVVIERNGRWLMVRRDEGRLWRGMWEFPRVRVQPGESLEQAVQRAAGLVQASAQEYEQVTTVRHGVMHYSVTLHALRCICQHLPLQDEDAMRWVSPQEALTLPVSSPMCRVISALLECSALTGEESKTAAG